MKTVLIPEENEKDLADVPDNVKSALQIIPVSHMDQVLQHALTGPLTPIDWNDGDKETNPLPVVDDLDQDAVVTH